jgi:hypothetical protein
MHVYSFAITLPFSWLLEFLFAFPFEHTRQIDSPHWTRQIDPPYCTRQIDPELWTRQMTCHLGPARLTHHFGPANAPLTRNSLAGPDPPTAPLPHHSDSDETERGGGGGRARPARASQAGTLLYCLTCKWPTYACAPYIHNVSIFNTERRNHF